MDFQHLRLRGASGAALDATVALALFGLLLATVKVAPAEASAVRWPAGLAYLAGAACTLPLALRRRAPVTVLALVTGGAIAFQALEPMNLVVPLAAVALAVYTTGVHGRPRIRDVARAAAAVALLALLWGLFVLVEVPGQAWPPRVALYALLLAAAWVGGEQTRRGGEREQELAARTAELEVERERSARHAVTEERLRIARELHDVLGHHVSMMAVQAGGAQRVLRTDPDRAEGALQVVQSSAQQAIQELQQTLTLLRDDNLDAAPPRRRLDELIADVRAAGVRVTSEIVEPEALPARLELAVTRIVQEALTNVVRHAGAGAAAHVSVSGGDDAVVVVVDDDGPADGAPAQLPRAATRSGGRGLAGLRERVELHGGRFDAGPRRGGGFRVRAVLPLVADAPATPHPAAAPQR